MPINLWGISNSDNAVSLSLAGVHIDNRYDQIFVKNV